MEWNIVSILWLLMSEFHSGLIVYTLYIISLLYFSWSVLPFCVFGVLRPLTMRVVNEKYWLIPIALLSGCWFSSFLFFLLLTLPTIFILLNLLTLKINCHFLGYWELCVVLVWRPRISWSILFHGNIFVHQFWKKILQDICLIWKLFSFEVWNISSSTGL